MKIDEMMGGRERERERGFMEKVQAPSNTKETLVEKPRCKDGGVFAV